MKYSFPSFFSKITYLSKKGSSTIMRGIADGIEPNDAVNKRQLDANSGGGGGGTLLGSAQIDLQAIYSADMTVSIIKAAFQIGDQVSDGMGNSATVINITPGSGIKIILTVTSITYMTTPPFVGVITGSLSGATGTFESLDNAVNETGISLEGGTEYLITDVLITQASVTPDSLAPPAALQGWGASDRGGVKIFEVNGMIALSALTNSKKFINHLSTSGMGQLSLFPTGGMDTDAELVSKFFVSINAANNVPCTVMVYVFGEVITP